jgi:threonine 3-dehydrogenase
VDDPRRQFDFWLGSWRCAWHGGEGTNLVEAVCGGRVLRESFDGRPAIDLVGTSISAYDESARRWVQTWMDSQGSWFHLTGTFRDDAMELVTTEPDARGDTKRMRFEDIPSARSPGRGRAPGAASGRSCGGSSTRGFDPSRIRRSMRALVKSRAEPGLWLEEVPEPEHGINDVLIRVHRTGICGTDVHIDRWDAWAQRTIPVPLVIGHEFVGEIVAVGSNVNDFHVGDLVSGEGHVVCGRCRNCMAGRRHLCAHTQGVGVDRPGAFAELIALPMTNIWHHAAGVDEDVAAIFDPFGNAVHTALAFPVLGEDVLITGAGPIGCMACAVVRHAGARHVVVSDPNRYRQDLALRMGATLAIDPTSRELSDVQAELGMTEGFDVALEMSGSPAALRSMLGNMSHGGRIAMLGIPSEEIAIDWTQVVFNMLTVRGIYGREMYETWYQMTVMLQSGLDIAPVITHRMGFEEFAEGFAVAGSGESGKVVLDWSDA